MKLCCNIVYIITINITDFREKKFYSCNFSCEMMPQILALITPLCCDPDYWHVLVDLKVL